MMFLKLLTLYLLLTSCEKIIYGEYRVIQNKKIYNHDFRLIYTVQPGDNLYFISQKKKVSINQIIKLNNIKFPYKIFPKQKLLIPNLKFHIVKKGETVYSISRAYNVDRFQLSKINKLKEKNLIFEGQKLIIPNPKIVEKNLNIKNIKVSKNKKEIEIKKNFSKFSWPVKGKVILNFGMMKPGLHNDGINIDASKGTSVSASKSGKVIYTGNEIPGYGNLVLIKHSNNWITAYAHLDKIFLKKGYKVSKGEKIGLVGNTGNVSKPQLHFEIRKGKKAINPLKVLS